MNTPIISQLAKPVLKLSVAEDGWLEKALQAISKDEPFSMTISGPAVLEIRHRVAGMAARLPLLSLWNGIKMLIPMAGTIPIDPTMLIPILAGIGGIGGAVGSMAFVAVSAVTHGMGAQLIYDPGLLFDPTDDKFTIALAPKPKSA